MVEAASLTFDYETDGEVALQQDKNVIQPIASINVTAGQELVVVHVIGHMVGTVSVGLKSSSMQFQG